MNESAHDNPLESRLVHDGRIVRLSLDTVRFPDGSTGELEMIRHSGAAAVVPIVERGGRSEPAVILVRQYRYAADGYLLEIPAGRPDREGEPWEECARRELEEETGLVAGRLERLGSVYTTPGFTDEMIHIFRATDLGEGSVSRDRDEFIEVQEIPISRILAMIGSGEITDAKTICGLHLAIS